MTKPPSTEFLSGRSQSNCPRRIVGSDTSNDRTSTINDINGVLDEQQYFIVGQRRGFPDCPAWYDAVNAGLDLSIHEVVKGASRFVHRQGVMIAVCTPVNILNPPRI